MTTNADLIEEARMAQAHPGGGNRGLIEELADALEAAEQEGIRANQNLVGVIRMATERADERDAALAKLSKVRKEVEGHTPWDSRDSGLVVVGDIKDDLLAILDAPAAESSEADDDVVLFADHTLPVSACEPEPSAAEPSETFADRMARQSDDAAEQKWGVRPNGTSPAPIEAECPARPVSDNPAREMSTAPIEAGEREAMVAVIMQHPWLESSYAGHTQGDCPSCPGRVIAGGFNSPSHAEHLADAILAARRAPIEDAEPVGYVDRDGDFWAVRRDGLSYHQNPAARSVAATEEKYGPLMPVYRHPSAPIEVTDEALRKARIAIHQALAPNWIRVVDALGDNQEEYDAMLNELSTAAITAALAEMEK